MKIYVSKDVFIETDDKTIEKLQKCADEMKESQIRVTNNLDVAKA